MSITFREFVELAEGKKKKKLEQPNPEPPNAVPGTYQEQPDGSRTYTLKPAKPLKKPLSKKLSKKEISKELERQGGIGGGAIRRELKKREKQQEGFSYGSKSFQQELEKKRKQEAEEKQTQRQKRSSDLYNERTRGRGIRARSKGKDGWIKNGVFTPDKDG